MATSIQPMPNRQQRVSLSWLEELWKDRLIYRYCSFFIDRYAIITASFSPSLWQQLGDFFASCTAGDIRVHFTAAVPKEVSVVAKQTDTKVVQINSLI